MIADAPPCGARFGASHPPKAPSGASAAVLPLLPHGDEAGVSARRRRVDRDGLLAGEALEIVRAARLGAGAREAGAAEGLRADDSPDHVAVDVAIADIEPG